MFLLTNTDADRTALVDEHSVERLSYREVASSVGAAAADLASTRKQLVFLLGSREVSCVIAYLASVEAGHAVVWIDPTLSAAAFGRLLATYRPELVALGSREPAPLSARAGYREEDHRLLGQLWRAREPVPAPPIHPELACLLSTSGSTGSGKLVRLRRESLVANATGIAEAQGLSSADVAITSLPIAHGFGLAVLGSHLVAGGTVVLTELSSLKGEFWRAIRDERVTSLAGVPLTFELLRRLDPSRIVPDTVTAMVQSGGRLDLEHIRFFRDFMSERGGSFRVGYGQTEATARMTVWPRETPLDKIGSVGRVIPGGEIRIDPTTSEIWYRGSNVMMGYADSRDDLARPGDLEELPTGDLGYLDDDGFLFLTGRAKRIAKVAGLRVNLDEVEALLEGVSAAAVEIGGLLGVYVEGAADRNLDAVTARLRDALSLDPVLLRVAAIERLPRSSAGKVLYSELERRPLRD